MYSTIKCTRNVGKPTYVQYFGAALLFIPVFLNFFPCEMSICCSIPVRHVYRFSVDWGWLKPQKCYSSQFRKPETRGQGVSRAGLRLGLPQRKVAFSPRGSHTPPSVCISVLRTPVVLDSVHLKDLILT